MAHQNQDHLYKNQQLLKRVLSNLLDDSVQEIKRHGNAKLPTKWLCAVAIICWGWTRNGNLAERLKQAGSVVNELLETDHTVTRQGMLQAMRKRSDFVDRIMHQFVNLLKELKGTWSSGGKVNLAVDGSKFAAPRTEANQQAFTACHRKANRYGKNYQTKADAAKAASVQVLATLFWHMSTGLPLRWQLGSAERTCVKDVLNDLPANARLIGDAHYVGYQFWTQIMDSGRSFLFRVGSNVRLLKNLGKVRYQDGYVSCWPDAARNKSKPPVILRLFKLNDGKKTIYLVTNELNMQEELAQTLYRQRWGVEVFFRTIKQSCCKSKLTCGRPDHVQTELHWTLIGLWLAFFSGKQQFASDRTKLSSLSPIKVISLFREVVQAIYNLTRNVASLQQSLTECTLAQESNELTAIQINKRKKNRGYPIKRKRKPCGKPILITPTRQMKAQAKAFV